MVSLAHAAKLMHVERHPIAAARTHGLADIQAGITFALAQLPAAAASAAHVASRTILRASRRTPGHLHRLRNLFVFRFHVFTLHPFKKYQRTKNTTTRPTTYSTTIATAVTTQNPSYVPTTPLRSADRPCPRRTLRCRRRSRSAAPKTEAAAAARARPGSRRLFRARRACLQTSRCPLLRRR